MSANEELAMAVVFLVDAAYEQSGRCPTCRSGRGLPKAHADWCVRNLAESVLKPPEFCDVCPHNVLLHNPDGTCGCGTDCPRERALRSAPSPRAEEKGGR